MVQRDFEVLANRLTLRRRGAGTAAHAMHAEAEPAHRGTGAKLISSGVTPIAISQLHCHAAAAVITPSAIAPSTRRLRPIRPIVHRRTMPEKTWLLAWCVP